MAEVVRPGRWAAKPAPQELVLTLAGETFAGWTDLSVTRSMEAAAGGFVIEYAAPKRPGWRIAAGQRCTVTLAGKPVIAGWIDAVRHRYDASDHVLTVSGRDASADLVDCTALHRPAEWRGLALLDLVRTLAQPFGITAAAEVDTGPAFEVFRLEPGETAWEAIERACRLRGCLAMPAGDGSLVVTRAGESGAASGLLTGGASGNVKLFEFSEDHSDRFSEYRIFAQRPGDGDGQPADFAHVAGATLDPAVKRYRPLVLPAEDAADPVAALARAQWEAAVRRARGTRARAIVVGWTDSGGELWRPNTKVRHRDPWMGDGEWLIATVAYGLSDEGGTATELELVPPEAYLTEPGAAVSAEARRRKKREQALDKLIERGESAPW